MSPLLLLPILLSWQITQYVDTLWVEPQGQLRVVEHLVVDFDGEWHHGIYRDIPVLYRTTFFLQSLGLRVVNVKRNGEPEPFRTFQWGTQLRIRMGSPIQVVTKVQDYRIEYTIQRGLDFYRDRSELYFNVVGDQWSVPIQRVSVVVIPTSPIKPKGALAYLGFPKGTQTTLAPGEIRPDRVTWDTGPVMPGQAFTLQIVYPPNAFTPLPWPTRLALGLKDNLFLLVPLLLLFLLWSMWYRYGRDPIPQRSIVPRYDPPEGLHPTLAGYLMDERLDPRDITACLFELARKGWIKIEELPPQKFWIFSSRDYRIHRLKESTQGLEPYEMEFIEALFEGGVKSVKLSALKNRFYRNLPRIRKAIEHQALQQRLFPANPKTIRFAFWFFAMLLVGIAFVLLFVGQIHLFWFGGLLISAIEIAGFGYFMPRKTRKGARLAWEVKGFYEFMRRVEVDRIRRLQRDLPTYFEQGLPYAVAFGLEERWSQAFLPLLQSPPHWYVSATPGSSLSFQEFSANLAHTTTAFTGSLTAAPRGSGSGGGGSAGGGIGGGGGGAW